MKKYKLSESKINEFWDLFFKPKKTPYEMQKVVDNDPVLKKLQADYEKLNYKAKDVIDKVQKESPAVYKLLIQKGLLPKD